MSSARQHAGIAVERAYRFVLWVIPTVEKFPRSQKLFLGDRIHTLALEVLEGLLEATYTKERLPILTRVNLLLEKLRVLFRLAKDLRHLDLRRYEYAAEEINEVGRLVGGWLKVGRGGVPGVRDEPEHGVKHDLAA